MKSLKSIALVVVLPLSLVACATVPSIDELQKLDKETLQSRLVGNTMTAKAEYGRWAEYYTSENSSIARAWGSWGSEIGKGSYQVNGTGELCVTYTGEHDWTSPEHEFCGIIYTDGEGNYFEKVTKNTFRPKREGKMQKVEIKTGDAYGLMN